ncbi:hypothetical protein Tco_0025523 [Tanacetum coccineum]
MRKASTAAKPCQEDSSEFYLIISSIYIDQRGTVVFPIMAAARRGRRQSVKVKELQDKRILKAFKLSYQEKYEHVQTNVSVDVDLRRREMWMRIWLFHLEISGTSTLDSGRQFSDNGDLSAYWREISFEKDFLGTSPSYTLIRDPMLRLCHMPSLVALLEGVKHLRRYLRLFTSGRKQGAMISGGQFVARLAEHLGLLTKERLQGLIVIVRDLPIINMVELVRIQICKELDDMWNWVASGPKRQPNVSIGAPKGAKDALAVDEGALADPAHMQAPKTPHAAPRTMTQRFARIEEEVHELWWSIEELRGDVDRSITDQSKFAIWMVSSMTQLMDTNGRTYQAFDNTLVGSSRLPYQRCTRRRTGDANTSTA